MQFIKNYASLNTSTQRKIALDLLDTALTAIAPKNVLEHSFVRNGDTLSIASETIDLDRYKRVFLIGFGKGSAQISQIIEKTVLDKITNGYVIDTVSQTFTKLHFTLGTHPIPSEQNVAFTENVLENITNLTEEDLVLVVICGGGSAMFEAPVSLPLERLVQVFNDLLKSGADISEMNVVRKHLSKVKGGGLTKHLYPAKVVSMIFSDVPGNDLSVIASGPTVPDMHTMEDTMAVLKKYQLEKDLLPEDFEQTPRDDKYFANVSNVIMLSNMTSISAIEQKAKKLGYPTRLYSDKLQGDAKEVGKLLLEQAKTGEILLAGGETTVHVKGKGQGGRNQALVLSALQFLDKGTIIVSIDSDGWDFYGFAGAIGDESTVEKAKALELDIQSFIDNDDSYHFFEKVGDGIVTDRLESNVADLMMVLKI